MFQIMLGGGRHAWQACVLFLQPFFSPQILQRGNREPALTIGNDMVQARPIEKEKREPEGFGHD